VTLIPVSKISLGFGAGDGGGGDSNKKGSQGTAGGATAEPLAFVVVIDDKVEMLSIKGDDGGGLGKLAELVPQVWETVRKFTGDKDKKKKKKEKEETEDATDD